MRVTTLGWGVKQSFRAYVEGSGGTITAQDGASRDPDGAFVFEAAEDSDLAVDARALSGTGRFRGRLAFQAHGGLLSVTLADPWLEAAADGWVLSIAETPTRRTAIARLGPLATDATLPAATTLDGMMILGDHYPPGTALDPVRLG
ncbi:HtaA domain-containing protein [Phenylobacterium sp.]|uniref:HtaA domain-containing protein n=1 Tax=Phenylobacterium sp. TaxID=1871053 RepID=UPI002ED94242